MIQICGQFKKLGSFRKTSTQISIDPLESELTCLSMYAKSIQK